MAAMLLRGNLAALAMAALMALAAVHGRPTYIGLIPNGDRVPNPDGSGTTCSGVGHLNCYGGGARNAFGNDFLEAGRTWTKELCMKDSDGDGVPNGVELGDPCCTWSAGGESPLRSAPEELGHPGFKTSLPATLPAADCAVTTEEEGEQPRGSTDHDSAPTAKFFNEGEEQRVQHFQFDVAIPADQDTTYYLVPFNFDVAEGEAAHLVGFEALIDNVKHMHHYVAFACQEPFPPEMVGVNVDEFKNPGFQYQYGCFETFYLWAPGQDEWGPPKNVGYLVGGADAPRSMMLQLHYDNPEMLSGLTDRSQMRINYTPTLREHDMGILYPGAITLNGHALPNSNRGYYTNRCAIQMDPRVADEVTIFGSAPHMHEAGRTIWSEVIGRGLNGPAPSFAQPGGEALQQLPRKEGFDASLNYLYETNTTLRAGDLIATTCIYDTTHREEQPVRGGPGSWDEMCINFMFFYPAKAIPVKFCRGDGQDTAEPFHGLWPEGKTSVLELPELANALLTPNPSLLGGFPAFTFLDPEVGPGHNNERPTSTTEQDLLLLPQDLDDEQDGTQQDAAGKLEQAAKDTLDKIEEAAKEAADSVTEALDSGASAPSHALLAAAVGVASLLMALL